MEISRDQLAALLGVDVPDPLGPVRGVAFDSREAVPGDVFVAVPGFRRDATEFAPGAVERGAVLVVAEKPVDGIPTAVVPDARAAMAVLAAAANGDPSAHLTVFGVTGTNGKTTSSFALLHILSTAYGAEHTGMTGTAEIVLAGEHTDAKHTTAEAPETQALLARMVERGVTHAVVEVSSHGIALHRITGTHFAGALFTNLTRDHLDIHGTMEEYYLTKRRLFEWTPGPKVANVEDEWGARLAREIDDVHTFGAVPGADFTIAEERQLREGMAFALRWDRATLELTTPLFGDYNVRNVAGAASLALAYGIEPDVVARAVATMPQVPGRFERVAGSGAGGVEVFVDYAHTEVGLEKVLAVARDVARADGHDGRVIAVFGACGDRDAAKRPLMGEVATRDADIAVITTDDPYTEDPNAIVAEIATGAGPDAQVIVDRREAIAAALDQARAGDVVVIAGRGHERLQPWADHEVELHDATVAAELLAR